MNIGDTTISAKLPAKGKGWKLGKLITFQIPNNIYLHQDNDIFFFVDFKSETELNVNSIPNKNQLKKLEKYKNDNIPLGTIEERNIKDIIINYNKNRCDRDGGCNDEERKKNDAAAKKIQAVHRGRTVRRRGRGGIGSALTNVANVHAGNTHVFGGVSQGAGAIQLVSALAGFN